MAEYAKGYGKRPLWQWIAIYVVVGGIIYAGVYYFYIAKKGGYASPTGAMYTNGAPTPTQGAGATVPNGY